MWRSILSDLNKNIKFEHILLPKNQLCLPGPVLGVDMVAPWLLVERVICIGINKTLKKEIAISTSYEGEIIEVCEKKGLYCTLGR